MTSPQDTKEIPLPTTTEVASAGSEKKDIDITASARNPDIIGECQLTFHKDGLVDVKFPYLGLLTLGRVEMALPQVYQALMRARAAALRVAEGKPEIFNT